MARKRELDQLLKRSTSLAAALRRQRKEFRQISLAPVPGNEARDIEAQCVDLVLALDAFLQREAMAQFTEARDASKSDLSVVLDIGRLISQGLLTKRTGTLAGPHESFSYSLTQNTSGLSLALAGDGLSQTLDLDLSIPAFGGERYWLVCSCGKRAMQLYLRSGAFGFQCRRCARLEHRSALGEVRRSLAANLASA